MSPTPPLFESPVVRVWRALRAHGHVRGAIGALACVALTGVLAGMIADRSFTAAALLIPLDFMRARDLRTIPVVDGAGRIAGMARRAELQDAANAGLTVAAALDPYAPSVRPDAPIQALLPLLSSGGVHEAVVLGADNVLIGVITQTDLLSVLYRTHVVERMDTAGTARAA